MASAELQPEAHFGHGVKGDRRVGVARTRKVNKAPTRLMKKVAEERPRRHRESMRTLQEWGSLKRMREECEVAAGEAEQRRCKPGGRFPEGLVKQVAAARIAQPRVVKERINRR